MNPLFRRGLVAPGLVVLATLIAWAAGGTGWALAVLAVGAAGVIGFHLYHLKLVHDWASGGLDAPVPEGIGAWYMPFAAIRRRVRLRLTHQRELRALIERFRLAAEAIPDGVVLLDDANHIEWANPRAIMQLGLRLPADKRHPITHFVRHPEFLAYVESGDWTHSVIIETMVGVERRLSMQLVPFGMDEKLLLSRDVTQIEAVARMRRDFIANVSHELKTPLTVIAGFVETMQDLDLDARQRTRYLGLMQDQSRNMQHLVSDLLTLSALESEHNPVPDDRFDVVPLLLEASAEAKALSGGQHTVSLEIGAAATVAGSREELASALGNLVSNAIRYTPSGGRIRLAWRVDDDGSGVFSVTDSGIGISPEHVPRLTERFYRVDRSRSRATGGTGLGLAIVKHVLLRHQADLEIASEPGQGSTFSVRLPAKRVQRAPDPDAAGIAPATPVSQSRIDGG